MRSDHIVHKITESEHSLFKPTEREQFKLSLDYRINGRYS